MCNQEGPIGNCSLPEDHEGWHERRDGYRGTRKWSKDWRKNDNRTTWRST